MNKEDKNFYGIIGIILCGFIIISLLLFGGGYIYNKIGCENIREDGYETRIAYNEDGYVFSCYINLNGREIRIKPNKDINLDDINKGDNYSEAK